MKNLLYITAFSLLVASSSISYANTFDGGYNFKIKTTRGNCSASSGQFKIEVGKISGTVVSDGTKFKIFGKVKDNGAIKGKISGGVATFKGAFENGKATVKWRNRFACAGDILIRK